jgi:hypothetical protein
VGNGNRVYVEISYVNSSATLAGLLYTYDPTTNPATLLGSVPVPYISSYSTTLQIFGNLLLCGTDVFALGGALPQLLVHLPLLSILDVDPSTNRLLGIGQEGIRIVDLTDPQNPKLSAAASSPVYTPSGALAPGDVFLSTSDGLDAFAVTWTNGPQYVTGFGGIDAWDLKLQGNLLFSAQSRSGLTEGAANIFNVYNIASGSPNLVGSYSDVSQDGAAVEISGSYAYLLCTNDLVVLNISNPSSPAKVASVPVGGVAMTLSGNKLFISSQQQSPTLVTVDISNPQSPTIIGQITTGILAYDVDVNGSLLAAALGSEGVALYDLTNPASPVQRWISTDGVPVYGVRWSGNLLYTACGESGLVIRDASSPTAPVSLGSNDLNGYIYGAFPFARSVFLGDLTDKIVYVGTDTSAAVFGLDVRDLQNPRVINMIPYGILLYGNDEGEIINSMAYSNGYLIVAGGGLGMPAMAMLAVNTPGNVVLRLPSQKQNPN